MSVGSHHTDDPRRKIEKDIVQCEVRITEQRILILLLRAQGRDTVQAERLLDVMEAEITELRARHAAMAGIGSWTPRPSSRPS